MRYYRQPYPNELWHYGIKGMHWGDRRYQNEDGSLTPAGKERYSQTVYDRGMAQDFRVKSAGGQVIPGRYQKSIPYQHAENSRRRDNLKSSSSFSFDRNKNRQYGELLKTSPIKTSAKVKEFFTGDIHEQDYARARMDYNSMSPSEATFYGNLADSILDDYGKHTLPGIADRVVLAGTNFVSKILSAISGLFKKR